MQLDHSFAVAASPDVTYDFLLDVNRVAGCVPGVSSVEAQGEDTFLGTLRIKVGPVGVTYRGTATIAARDARTRSATIAAEGIEGVGAGRVRATAIMAVTPAPEGSLVTISTDLAIAGRLAQFGRGVIDSVARGIVRDMAACIRRELEVPATPPAGGTS